MNNGSGEKSRKRRHIRGEERKQEEPQQEAENRAGR